MTMRTPDSLQGRDRFGRAFLDGIGDRGDRQRRAHRRREIRRSWLRRASASARACHFCVSTPLLLQEGAAADEDAASIDRRLRRPGRCATSKSAAGSQATPPSFAACDDRMRDRVLGRPLGGGEQHERFVSRDAVDLELGQRGPAERERAGLVDDERIDVAHALDRFGVAKQDARARTLAHRDGHRDRRCQAHRARAGDDEHGDRVEKRIGRRRLGAEEPPHDSRQRPRWR